MKRVRSLPRPKRDPKTRRPQKQDRKTILPQSHLKPKDKARAKAKGTEMDKVKVKEKAKRMVMETSHRKNLREKVRSRKAPAKPTAFHSPRHRYPKPTRRAPPMPQENKLLNSGRRHRATMG